jgi:hypothetical protein
MADSIGYQWFIFLFTTAIVVICIINIINYNQISSNFNSYKVTVAFTADPIGNPSVPIPQTNIGVGKAYVNGDLVSVTNASLTGFQRGSFNATLATYDINTGEATFSNAVNVDGTTFGASTYNIAPTVNPDGMTEGAILTAKWINWILLILALIVWVWRVILFFKTPEDVAAATIDKLAKPFEAGARRLRKTRDEKGQILADKVKLVLDAKNVDNAGSIAENVKNVYLKNTDFSKREAVLAATIPQLGERNALFLSDAVNNIVFSARGDFQDYNVVNVIPTGPTVTMQQEGVGFRNLRNLNQESD